MRAALAAFVGSLMLSIPGQSIAADAPPPAPPKVDPTAIEALNRMGAEMRSHDVVVLKSDITNEDVLDNGQKLQYTGTVEISAHRPSRLKISVVSDLKNRQIFYDGKSVTVFSPRLGFYASFPAPETIAKTLAKANDEYGIELPLSDLFSWGLDKSLTARLQEGFLVDDSEHVGDQVCSHYAFRQQNVDWQVWVAQSGPPLPCKLVITDKRDPSMPQYSAVLHWSFPGSIADSVFAFAPPPTAKKIMIATVGEANGAKP